MNDLALTFNAEEIVEALAKTRCEVRRTHGLEVVNAAPEQWQLTQFGTGVYTLTCGAQRETIQCPYGFATGIRNLWACEKWRTVGKDARGAWIDVEYAADKAVYRRPWPDSVYYHEQWRPGQQMPREFCRFEHRLVQISLKRLNEISPEEGHKSIAFYERWWDVKHPKTPFHTNPWVWCIRW